MNGKNNLKKHEGNKHRYIVLLTACCMFSIPASFGQKSDCKFDFPTLFIRGVILSKDCKAMLAAVADTLKNNPNCAIKITTYPSASKSQQSLGDKKLAAVKTYLFENLGISLDRMMTDVVIGGGDGNTVDIISQ